MDWGPTWTPIERQTPRRITARLAAHVFGSTKLFGDDTPIPVLDPGRGRTKTGRLWVYARDDRPWSGPEPPAAVYFYSPDRKAKRPAAHLQDFRGVLQVDRYAGFQRLTAPGVIVLAACWAHARRKFYDLHEATGSPIAAEIAELYAIERSIQGRTADARRHVRNTSARPLIEMMKRWLEMELGRVPPAGPLAEAIRYALARWPALTRFLDDGRIELDNNPVERAAQEPSVRGLGRGRVLLPIWIAKTVDAIYAGGRYNRPTLEGFLKSAVSFKDGLSEADYQVRLDRDAKTRVLLEKVMDDNHLDAVVYPLQKRLVVPVTELNQADRNGILASVTGFPAITVPAGFSAPTNTAPLGVPVGMDILGKPWSDAKLLSLAYSFKQATHFRRSPESAPPLPSEK
jgi:hypothetical protein